MLELALWGKQAEARIEVTRIFSKQANKCVYTKQPRRNKIRCSVQCTGVHHYQKVIN